MFFGKRKKYSFNNDTLTFDQVTHSIKDHLIRLLVYTILGGIIAIIAIIVTFSYIKTPAHQKLEKENEGLKHQFSLMEKHLNTYLEVMDYLETRDNAIYREFFGVAPIDSYSRKGEQKIRQYDDLLNLDEKGIVLTTQKKLEELKRRLYIQSISYDTIHDLVRNREDYWACMPAIQPISNATLTRIASGFGVRVHPIFGILKPHTGVDFAAPTGTPVYATGNGEVIRIQNLDKGYGKNIIIRHGYGVETLYAHLSAFEAKINQKVKRGDIIAYVGNTGTSTAPHLHYEVIRNNKKVDPIKSFFSQLTPEEYEEILKLSQNATRSFD